MDGATAFQQARDSLPGMAAVSLPAFNGPSRHALFQHLVHRPVLENPLWQELPFLWCYWPLLHHLGTAGDPELCKATSLGWEIPRLGDPSLPPTRTPDQEVPGRGISRN